MGLFAPDIADTPEDRGRLPALDAEAVRHMAASSVVSKARIRRFAELNADDESGSEDDSDAEELEERARRKRKSMCPPVLPCLGRLHGQQRWTGAHWCGDGAAGREALHAGHRVRGKIWPRHVFPIWGVSRSAAHGRAGAAVTNARGNPRS